jgi:hypothetical protein
MVGATEAVRRADSVGTIEAAGTLEAVGTIEAVGPSDAVGSAEAVGRSEKVRPREALANPTPPPGEPMRAAAATRTSISAASPTGTNRRRIELTRRL